MQLNNIKIPKVSLPVSSHPQQLVDKYLSKYSPNSIYIHTHIEVLFNLPTTIQNSEIYLHTIRLLMPCSTATLNELKLQNNTYLWTSFHRLLTYNSLQYNCQ